MKTYTYVLLLMLLVGCKGNSQENKEQKIKTYAVTKTDSEWKEALPDMAYYVLRK